jgi:hypothetical protein
MSVEEPKEITEDEANELSSNDESQDGEDDAIPAVGEENAEGNDEPASESTDDSAGDSANNADGEGDE